MGQPVHHRFALGQRVLTTTAGPGMVEAVMCSSDELGVERYLVRADSGPSGWHKVHELDVERPTTPLQWPPLDPVGTTSPAPEIAQPRPWLTHPSVHAPKCYDCRHHGMGLEGSVGQCLHPSQPRSLVSGVSLVAPGTARGDKGNCGPDGTLFAPATPDTASLANRLRSRRDTV